MVPAPPVTTSMWPCVRTASAVPVGPTSAIVRQPALLRLVMPRCLFDSSHAAVETLPPRAPPRWRCEAIRRVAEGEFLVPLTHRSSVPGRGCSERDCYCCRATPGTPRRAPCSLSACVGAPELLDPSAVLAASSTGRALPGSRLFGGIASPTVLWRGWRRPSANPGPAPSGDVSSGQVHPHS